ncbi:MAG: cobaltochelatase subunit CobN, partial [Cytophagaceae bacterium]|nr:cobaltochelatase subunit CobN [Cytophagaceae bacterium]
MMKNKRKITVLTVLILVFLGGIWMAWDRLASPTNIALVNFQPFQTTSIVKANSDKFIQYTDVSLDELNKLKKYDFVLGFGMGMRITAEQRAQIQQAADKGVPVYIHAATNPENNICNLDSLQLKSVQSYLNSGNKRNNQSLARYVRQHIDQKTFFVTPADTAVETASDVLYHLDENVWFDKTEQYEKYLKAHKYYTGGGAKVAIVGGMNDPFSGNRDNIDSLIVSLQRAGMNVYPVSSFMKR